MRDFSAFLAQLHPHGIHSQRIDSPTGLHFSLHLDVNCAQFWPLNTVKLSIKSTVNRLFLLLQNCLQRHKIRHIEFLLCVRVVNFVSIFFFFLCARTRYFPLCSGVRLCSVRIGRQGTSRALYLCMFHFRCVCFVRLLANSNAHARTHSSTLLSATLQLSLAHNGTVLSK